MKTTRQWVGSLIAVALFGALIGVGASSADAAQKVTTTVTKVTKLTKAGWWIRVHPDKTSATKFWLNIGTTKRDSKLWRTWAPGEPEEFDVPAEFLNAAKLYIQGRTEPLDKHAKFCVFYMDHAVREFHFAGYVDHNMKPSDTDFLHKCKP
jgi:hypothetical protein